MKRPFYSETGELHSAQFVPGTEPAVEECVGNHDGALPFHAVISASTPACEGTFWGGYIKAARLVFRPPSTRGPFCSPHKRHLSVFLLFDLVAPSLRLSRFPPVMGTAFVL